MGSWHCLKWKRGVFCDLCSHVDETRSIKSLYFNRPFKIHGYLSHEYSPLGLIRWFVYLINECCLTQYIGSTNDTRKRWANHKKDCKHAKINKDKKLMNQDEKFCRSTGLTSHFKDTDCFYEHEKLRFVYLDYYDATTDKLKKAGHEPGPKCRCAECSNLKSLEDYCILRMGTLYGNSGLNRRYEIKNKTIVRSLDGI